MKFWDFDIDKDGKILNGKKHPEPISYIDHQNERWVFGKHVFEDGTIIPWMRLQQNYVVNNARWNDSQKRWIRI